MATPPIKGRGATSNTPGRFAKTIAVRELDDELSADETRPADTEYYVDATRSIIARNESPDIPFALSINPYRGCEHGCIYCFARPSHSYLDLSPGLDFERKIFVKENAAELLRKELSKPSYQCQWIAMGANTDPYQPVEKERRITRQILEVMQEFNQPVGIVTKGSLIQRDIDILAAMAEKGLAEAIISVTTLSNELKTKLEPRASTGAARLETLRRLTEAGIPTGVLFAPVIPFVNDAEMENILAAASEAGARQAGYVFLRLPWELKALFSDWLEAHYQQKKAHVLSLVSQSRGGKLNQTEFKQRMKGEGQYAEMIAQRFRVACQKNGLNRTPRGNHLRTDLFRVPNSSPQFSLF